MSNRADSRKWHWTATIAEISALAAAGFLVFVPAAPSLVGIATSAAAAATARGQLGRHDELGQSYAMAARELTQADLRMQTLADERAFVALVTDVEEAISREHTMWAIKRGVQ